MMKENLLQIRANAHGIYDRISNILYDSRFNAYGKDVIAEIKLLANEISNLCDRVLEEIK